MDDLDILAAEFVLGTLGSEARASLAERLGAEPDLHATVEKWERRLAALDAEAPSVEVSPGLWDRVRAAIEAPPTDFLTIRAREGEWEIRSPGVERKTLFVDHEAGVGHYLFRMAPGSVIREHTHGITEECVMLEGETTFADTYLRAGDFHVAFTGSTHNEIASQKGALFYLRGAIS